LNTKAEIAHYIASLAQRAILYEVSTTPKPGLVDRDNSGAHKDMDFFTFMASSSALYRGMYDCTMEGLYFKEEESTILLDRIRIPGIQCEKAMFEATNGVNTHKGIIFSLGILCAAAGNLYEKSGTVKIPVEELCEKVKKLAENLTSRDFAGIHNKKVLTHGERLYKEYGYKGIRGEVEGGFLTVREKAVPILRNWEKDKAASLNDLFLEILLNIMTVSEDTNIIIRGGRESLAYVKTEAYDFLQSGGMNHPKAIDKLTNMNEKFIDKNISPGGSADLLAVSIFLGLIEGVIK
jgi:triphosphoribosyl-dephospho-CoA synthase